MEAFMAWLKSVNDVVWGPGMLVLLVGTGLYLTVGLKFFTFRNFFRGLKNLWAGRSNQSEQGEISPFNALMTALAADIGTGKTSWACRQPFTSAAPARCSGCG